MSLQQLPELVDEVGVQGRVDIAEFSRDGDGDLPVFDPSKVLLGGDGDGEKSDCEWKRSR